MDRHANCIHKKCISTFTVIQSTNATNIVRSFVRPSFIVGFKQHNSNNLWLNIDVNNVAHAHKTQQQEENRVETKKRQIKQIHSAFDLCGGDVKIK